MHTRTEMLDLVLVDGRTRGIVVRDLLTGTIRSFAGDAVILATGGYGNIYHLSTNARGSNATAIWRAYRRGAGFANPCFTQIHPTCIPASGPHQSKLTLMSESLRNDARVWVPKLEGDGRSPSDIPPGERDYFLERRYPTYGNLAPRDIASRAAKEICDAGMGVGPGGRGVYLDLGDAIDRLGGATIRARYGNVLEMYEQITGDNPYRVPMRIYPAVHYTMGGLWVDYDLRSTLAGLYVLGEANFSDHGANRLGASALMQGLADGYFILPNTISDELARSGPSSLDVGHSAFRDAERSAKAKLDRLIASRGTRTVEDHFRELGNLLWEHCGMARSEGGLSTALERIPVLQSEFQRDLRLPGTSDELNESLERASRLADYYGLAELMCRDALERRESCGAHFRVEHQTPDGEAQRDDEHFAHVSVWKYQGEDKPPNLHEEPLSFETVTPGTRSYT
jgi:succinate dehydrogenase / fumarate reductase flavoprotein subunit